MLPGWMSGHYTLADISVDAQSLCAQAGVRFIQQSLAKVDAESGVVATADGEHFDYDVLSLNTGANTDMRWLNKAQDTAHTATKVIAVRPISLFVERWQQIIKDAKQSTQ